MANNRGRERWFLRGLWRRIAGKRVRERKHLSTVTRLTLYQLAGILRVCADKLEEVADGEGD